ncbi:hypothetical protein [Oceanicella sp. SM1341]|uniref:hypothetical protein n=1 Tax=Oceanicella sp. SM1341 TaxID=1548889 RepID=UPI000E4F8119|nr:hypothetical protein [Oceanicella sp. SM1341]
MPTLSPALPDFLAERLREATADAADHDRVIALMRPADEVMRVDTLRLFKASRLSFADMFCRRMATRGWQIRRVAGEVDDEGAGQFVYEIEAEGHEMTYIARAYPWDGVEKVGRRSDGALRDMFGALFVGRPDAARIAREFATFDVKSEGVMRTDADVIGWTPANRSSRHFDAAVDALAAGRQPEEDLAYLMRNGGFQASGRNGSISFQGISEDNPLSHPFFADIFAIWLVRVFSIDLVNAVARRRNPGAARLAPDAARSLGIGNSSGQGMCVALQRWPHWVATWVLVRELALAYAKSREITPAGRATLSESLARTIAIYRSSDPQVEDYVVPNGQIIAGLTRIEGWLATAAGTWDSLARRVEEQLDGETREQFHSLLLDTVPEFCDAVAPWFAIGAGRQRRFDPCMSVAGLRDILRRNYGWALTTDRSLAATHQHFWYHSVDNGEQRRGDRIIDPHEAFESFIDHVGLIQRLASVLTAFPDGARAGEVALAHPDLHYAMSRVQYLDGLPYAEIRDSIAHRDFRPADLIRFFLGSLGIRGAVPLSIRYVRGTFFQREVLPEDIAATAPAAADQTEEVRA